MMNIKLFSALLTAFGLGSIVTAFVQAWLTKKSYIENRNFQEKKEAYVGFLRAAHRQEVEKTKESALFCGHMNNLCELVGSKEVIRLLRKFKETNPVNNKPHPGRPEVTANLKNAMRKDLGVSLEVDE
jgi:hypothetical protein